jgi:hypothetical protein
LAVLKRTPEEAREQTEQEFGNVDKDDCEKLVKHVEKWITQWMKHDDGGSLQQYESFNDLVKNGPGSDPTPPELMQEDHTDDSDSDEED